MSFVAKFNRPVNVPAGTYNAILFDVKDCEITFQDVTKDGLMFRYMVEHQGQEVELQKRVAKTVSERGNLYKDLKAMLGAELTTEVLADDERLAGAIKSCINKNFIVVVDLNDKGFNRIVSVAAAPGSLLERLPRSPGGQGAAKPGVVKQSLTGFENMPDANPKIPHTPADKDELPF